MYALIRMDWTLNRRILFQYSPFFVLWIAMGISRGMQSLLGMAFAAAALGMGMTLLQNLRDTVEPFVCALPVSRRQIVLARYTSTLIAMTLPLSFFFLLGWVGKGAGFPWARAIQAGDLAMGLGLLALTLSAGLFLYLPFHFRFGGDRGLGLFTATLMACLITLFAICGWEGLLEKTLLFLTRMLDERVFATGVLASWAALGAASISLSVLAYGKRITRRPLSPALPVLLLVSAFLALGLSAQAASRAVSLSHGRATPISDSSCGGSLPRVQALSYRPC